MTFNKFIIIHFCYWKRQKITITGKVYGSVALLECGHLVSVCWGEGVLGELAPAALISSCGPAHLACLQLQAVGGNVEPPVGGLKMLAFQENAYKCTINCQELSLLLQVSCNLQDSITQEISCGLTNSTAI